MGKMPPSVIVALIAATVSGFCGWPAQAQQSYAGLQARAIKALSDSQIADLRAGKGMGLALAAELNNYPGPAHVIELAEALALTKDQLDQIKRLRESMTAEAIALGDRLIQQEADLDRHFADRTITATTLNAAADQIGQTQGRLRAAHLRYHLSMVDILTPDQVKRYSELRGYTGATTQPHHRYPTSRH